MRIASGIIYIVASIVFSFLWMIAFGCYAADMPVYGNPSDAYLLLIKFIMGVGFIYFFIVVPLHIGKKYFLK